MKEEFEKWYIKEWSNHPDKEILAYKEFMLDCWIAATEAAKPKWKPIDNISNKDKVYLFRRKDDKFPFLSKFKIFGAFYKDMENEYEYCEIPEG
jgi:hypothetical protein